VYFEGTDTIGHLFMPYRPPRLPPIPESRFRSFDQMVDRYYETADAMVGKLLEGREDWTVLVVSDHGFASDATRPLTTDSRIGHGAAADWHRRFGILVLSGPGVRKGIRLDEASVNDIAPTILALFGQPVPRSWPGRVLGAALDPGFLASHPVTFRTTDPKRSGAAPATGGSDEEAEELRAKLESLGYVGPAGSGRSMTTSNNRGVALLAQGKYEDAAVAFREAIRNEPDQPTLWVNLGIALRNAGKPEEARDLFRKAIERPEASRAAGHQLAQLLMDEGNLREAEQVLRRVLRDEPGAAEVRNALGLVLDKSGRPKEAWKEFSAAADLDPNAAEPRNNLGNLAKAERRRDEAARWYEKAIAADPYFMGAYNNLALLHQENGELTRAVELYGRALAKAPTNAVVLNNLASLYFGMADYGEAKTLWERAMEADPAYAEELRRQLDSGGVARIFVPAAAPLSREWVPDADLRAVRALPVLIVAGRDDPALRDAVAALVDDLDDAEIVVTQRVPTGDMPLEARTVALLNRGVPSFAVEADGTLHTSLMRSCTGWPSGVWTTHERRSMPDGSNFQLQHWTHTFDYAVVADDGDWRRAATANTRTRCA